MTKGNLRPPTLLLEAAEIQQSESTHVADKNLILMTTRLRYHNAVAIQTGPVQDPSVTPSAWVAYVAQNPDAVRRTVNSRGIGAIHRDLEKLACHFVASCISEES